MKVKENKIYKKILKTSKKLFGHRLTVIPIMINLIIANIVNSNLCNNQIKTFKDNYNLEVR